MRDIGKNIKDLRVQAKMTQEEMAEKLFVTRQTVSNYENGKSRPDLDMLLKIAELFATDANTVIYGNQLNQNKRKKYQRILILAGIVIAMGILMSWLCDIAILYRNQTYILSPYALAADLGLPGVWMFAGWWLIETLSLFMGNKIKDHKYVNYTRVILFVVIIIVLIILLSDVIYHVVMDISWARHGEGEWSFSIPYIPLISDISRFVILSTYRYPIFYSMFGILSHLLGLSKKEKT